MSALEYFLSISVFLSRYFDICSFEFSFLLKLYGYMCICVYTYAYTIHMLYLKMEILVLFLFDRPLPEASTLRSSHAPVQEGNLSPTSYVYESPSVQSPLQPANQDLQPSPAVTNAAAASAVPTAFLFASDGGTGPYHFTEQVQPEQRPPQPLLMEQATDYLMPY